MTPACLSQIDETQPNFSLAFHHKVRDGATPLTHYGAPSLPSPPSPATD